MAEPSGRMPNLPGAWAYPVTYDNVGIDVSVWLTSTLVILVVLVKISLRYAQLRRLLLDDVFIVVAAFVAIGQSIAVLEQASDGLGQDQAMLSSDQFMSFQQADYASAILYVLAVGFCKLALAATIDRLSSLPIHKNSARSLMAFSACWTFIAVIATLAQCSKAQFSWETLSPICFNQAAFWSAMSAFDIISDFVLVGLAAFILWDVQATTSKRVKVIATFSAKLISFPFIAARIALERQAVSSPDRVGAAGSVAIATQFALNLGIVAACIPYLKARLCQMEDGLYTQDMRLEESRTRQVKKAKVKFVDTPYERKGSIPRPRPAPLKSRHISIRATAAKSPGANSPVTPSKMQIRKHTSFWVEEEETPPELPQIPTQMPRQSEDWFPC